LDGKVTFETFFGKDLGGYLQDQALFVLSQGGSSHFGGKGRKNFSLPAILLSRLKGGWIPQ